MVYHDVRHLTCPECGVDLTYEKDGNKYSRTIGVEVRGEYDGVLFWYCPDCKAAWPRFTRGPLGQRSAIHAERHMTRLRRNDTM